jgi:ABC-type multidrug transport system ATPase subunit
MNEATGLMSDLTSPAPPAAAPIIDVHGLCKNFGPRRVVNDLSLRVAAREVCGFLGANGSGKTTTLRMLCGLLTPDAGTGTCLGLDILRDAAAIRRQVGYMTQRFSYYEDLTVAENLDLVAGVYEMPNPDEAVRDIIARMELGGYAKELAGNLSGGWKQRLALAACVLHRPRLLLLDEPTAGVDAKARREFWDLIHDMAGEGLTVLVSTHYMDEAERCNRIIYLANGRIVVEGDAMVVAQRSGLITYDGVGPRIEEVAQRMRGMPGVEAAGVFHRALHIAGTDRTKLEQAIGAVPELQWREVEPRIEDVFIHELSVRNATPHSDPATQETP